MTSNAEEQANAPAAAACSRLKPPNAPTLPHGNAVSRPASQDRERRPARPNGGPKAKAPPNRPNGLPGPVRAARQPKS
jgi:hypothetical protein